ncbi:hypothetical protein F511_35805 [Dorcoceras hygrometricum]|uniref:Uncharacterized protein n=1 Tax=Dorcoceras hygrometricum TaxID=472368 RepID=A0A2Z7CJH3_9LAMI|nr:hypothetical protein F511_35805 [Dorcoceras hygrometricum]
MANLSSFQIRATLLSSSNFSAASLLFFIGFYNRYDDVTVAATIFFNKYDDVMVAESRFLSISNADIIVAARSFFLLVSCDCWLSTQRASAESYRECKTLSYQLIQATSFCNPQLQISSAESIPL